MTNSALERLQDSIVVQGNEVRVIVRPPVRDVVRLVFLLTAMVTIAIGTKLSGIAAIGAIGVVAALALTIPGIVRPPRDKTLMLPYDGLSIDVIETESRGPKHVAHYRTLVARHGDRQWRLAQASGGSAAYDEIPDTASALRASLVKASSY